MPVRECGNYEFIVFAIANGCTSYNQLLNKKLISSAVCLGSLEATQWGMDQVLPQGLRWIDRGITVDCCPMGNGLIDA